MHRIFALFAGFASIVFGSYAQTIKMKTGPIIEKKDFKNLGLAYRGFLRQSMYLPRRAALNTFFDTDSNTGYVLFSSANSGEVKLGRLNNYVSLAGAKAFSAKTSDIKADFYPIETILTLNTKKIMIYATYVAKTGEGVVYASELDDKLTMVGTPLKLITVSREGKFIALPSENNESLLLLTISAARKNENPKISGRVLDKDLKELWQADLEFNVREGGMRIGSVDVDDAGNFYALTYSDNEKRQKVSLYQYVWKQKAFRESSMGSRTGKNFGCLLKVVDGKAPIVSGLFKQEKEYGYFVAMANPENGSVHDVMTRKLSPAYVDIMEKGFYQPEHFGVNHIIGCGGSNYALSIEGNLEIQKNGTSIYYYSSAVLVSSFNSGGNVLWERTVYKEQYVPLMAYVNGHSLLAQGDNVVVIYNDHVLNIKIDANEQDVRNFRGENVAVTALKIDPSGNATKERVATGKSESFGFYPLYLVKINEKLFQTQVWDLDFRKFLFAYATLEIQ